MVSFDDILPGREEKEAEHEYFQVPLYSDATQEVDLVTITCASAEEIAHNTRYFAHITHIHGVGYHLMSYTVKLFYLGEHATTYLY